MKPATLFAFIISLIVQVSYPLVVTLLYRRRTQARWQLFAYGAIVFALFQLFTWLPLSAYLDVIISSRLNTEMGAFVWLLALALMTSLVEELGRWWGYRYLFPRGNFRLTWRNGVMYGLGHGSIETLLLIAGLTFIMLLAYILLSQMDLSAWMNSMGAEANPAVRTAIEGIINTAWTQPLMVAWERVLALPHQVAWALLVMASVLTRQKRWFGFAVLYHASVAVIVPGLARLFGFVVAEGVNAVLAFLSLWIIFKLRDILAGREA